MKKNPDVVERKIHDTYFLIHTKQKYANDTCSLYEINEIGSFIWNAFDNNTDVDDVTKAFVIL